MDETTPLNLTYQVSKRNRANTYLIWDTIPRTTEYFGDEYEYSISCDEKLGTIRLEGQLPIGSQWTPPFKVNVEYDTGLTATIRLMTGQIRVGRITYKNGKKVYPSYSGFIPIEVMTRCSKYGSLSPYELKTRSGLIMENVWQGAKLYEWVPATKQSYSRWDSTVIWDHPEEVHMYDDGDPTEEYWAWRQKLMECEYAIRWPVGRNHTKYCQCAWWKGRRLTYIQARKIIYLPLYLKLVRRQKQYRDLLNRVAQGENLLIIEVDGPHQESLPYYQQKYGAEPNLIEQSTMLANGDNLRLMLNDPKHPFGHGYCLAAALLIDLKKTTQ